METLNQKRSRLRGELQDAYRGWLNSAKGAVDLDTIDGARIDLSGIPDVNKAEWLAYRAARSRLVKAYAESPDSQ